MLVLDHEQQRLPVDLVVQGVHFIIGLTQLVGVNQIPCHQGVHVIAQLTLWWFGALAPVN